MEVKIVSGKAVFSFPITGDNIVKAKNIPGDTTWVGTKIHFPPRVSSLDYILEKFPEVVLQTDLEEKYRQQKENNKLKTSDKSETTTFEFKTKPFEHQLVAFELVKDRESFALLMEMGTGKTKVSIDDIAYQYTQNKIDTVIVVAPNGVHRNWVDNEIPIHMPDGINYTALFWSGLKNKKSVDAMEEFIEFEGLRVLTINYEAIITKKGKDVLSRLIDNSMIILDESTRIKNPTAKVTKELNGSYRGGKFFPGLRDFATIRRILTGTPITQGPLDIFSQFYFLDKNHLGYRDYYSFRANYAKLKQIMTKTKTGKAKSVDIVDSYVNIDDLKKRIEPHSFRVLKEDCLDLPPKVFEKIYYKMSSEQERLYTEMKDFLIAEINDMAFTAKIPLTKLLRLRQILGGFVQSEDGELIVIDPNARMKKLEELLSDVQGQVIIWSVFVEEIRAIRRLLGEDAVAYYGEVNPEDRAQAIARFQKGDAKYFIGQPRAAGLGLTLTAASNVVYYSNDYSLESRLQSEDRAHRHGQINRVTYFDIIAENTIDEKIIKALRDKLNVAQLITGDNIKEWL